MSGDIGKGYTRMNDRQRYARFLAQGIKGKHKKAFGISVNQIRSRAGMEIHILFVRFGIVVCNTADGYHSSAAGFKQGKNFAGYVIL